MTDVHVQYVMGILIYKVQSRVVRGFGMIEDVCLLRTQLCRHLFRQSAPGGHVRLMDCNTVFWP